MFISFSRFLLIKLGFIAKPDLVTYVTEAHPVSDEIDAGRLYLVKGGKIDKWACFKCPDDCGEIIKLSLSQSRRPRWSVLTDWLNRPTINPSVRQLSGCFSHFWVKKGKVHWCPDSGRGFKTVISRLR